MIVREMTAPGRGIMTASHQGETHTAIATTAGEAAVVVTAVAAVGVGARIASATATERGIETETGTEIGIEIAAGAGHTAELGPEAGVEVINSSIDLKLLKALHTQSTAGSLFSVGGAVTPQPGF